MTTARPVHAPIMLAPGGGESFKMLGDRIEVLASTAATGGACFVFIEEVPPAAGPALHRHAREDEFFYVLEGTFRFRIDGRDYDASPGTFAFAPKGSVHTFANTGDRLGRLLIWTTPPEIERAFRACSAANLTPADSDRLAEMFGKVGVTFEGPPLMADGHKKS